LLSSHEVAIDNCLLVVLFTLPVRPANRKIKLLIYIGSLLTLACLLINGLPILIQPIDIIN